MTDEKFVFIEDCKDKKRTARGAFNKRTHCGKGGAVKFPSDYLTAKERKAMNGECTAYRMNDPMKWDEFKKMPTDLQRTYILALREKFGAHDRAISTMMGITAPVLSRCNKVLGISLGRAGLGKKFDEEAWTRWVNGVPQVTCYDEIDEAAAEATTEEPTEFMTEEVKEYVEQDIAMTESVIKQVTDPDEFAKLTSAVSDSDDTDLPNSVSYVRIPHYEVHDRAAMTSGRLCFEGNIYDILGRVGAIIGTKNVEMTISWTLKED